MQIHRIGDVTVLNDYVEVPGLGFLPVNAFVLHAEHPVVIDTGLSTTGKDFVSALSQVMDPADVRWVWITHPDRDHTGGLWTLLQAAPQARMVSTFTGVGIMSCEWAIPLNRVYLLNPGQVLDVGDRRLHAFRPPLFDSPATTGFLDDRSGALFSSDCFRGTAAHRGSRHVDRCARRRRPGSRPAAAVGVGRQSLGAPGRSGPVPRHRRPGPGHGSLRRVQHPPTTCAAARRPALRDRGACAGGATVRRTRPGGARGAARHLRTSRTLMSQT
jgi:Metallo-beta-lactamase superfamily